MPRATDEQRAAFGAELASSMDAAGVDRRTLAEAFNVTTQAVDYWVTGKREPDLRTIANLEVFLGAQGRFITALGYDPSATRKSSRWQAPPDQVEPPEADLRIAASGTDLDELRTQDPEAYEAIVAQARIALRRARERRQR